MAEGRSGADDSTVLNLAMEHQATLLTSDKDFGELVFRQGRANHGVILVRLAGLSGTDKARLVRNAVARHEDELATSFVVISPGHVRLRRILD